MDLHELGDTIRRTRVASGISQAQLARMAGVSRATLNYVEQGRSAIGADALLRILPPLGLSIVTAEMPSSDSKQAIELLAASASVSYRVPITPNDVERAVVTGAIEERWLPHIATIVDEASDPMLLRAVREISLQTSVPATQIWRNMKNLAHAVASPHPRWI